MRMSSIFALLAGTSLAGMLAALGTGLAQGAGEAAFLHRGLGLAGAILMLFTHSIVFVYMIGTGRAIKDAVRDHGVDRAFYVEHVGYKWQASPWAMTCASLSVATAVLGGMVEAGAAAAWLHPLVALATVVAQALGLPAEYRTIRANGRLLDRVAEATAERNRAVLERGEDPAPPLSPLSATAWTWILAVSAWLPWLYIRFIMGERGAAWWPFAVLSLLFLLGGLGRRPAQEEEGSS